MIRQLDNPAYLRCHQAVYEFVYLSLVQSIPPYSYTNYYARIRMHCSECAYAITIVIHTHCKLWVSFESPAVCVFITSPILCIHDLAGLLLGSYTLIIPFCTDTNPQARTGASSRRPVRRRRSKSTQSRSTESSAVLDSTSVTPASGAHPAGHSARPCPPPASYLPHTAFLVLGSF